MKPTFNYPLDEKILTPLLAVMNLSEADKKLVKNELSQLIIKKILIVALESLPKSALSGLNKKLEQETKETEKIALVRQAVQQHLQAQKAVESYLEKELPEFIKKILFAFLEKATPEQKERLLKLSQ